MVRDSGSSNLDGEPDSCVMGLTFIRLLVFPRLNVDDTVLSRLLEQSTQLEAVRL